MNWIEIIFGRLTWAALPHEWFTLGGTVAVTGMMLSAAALLTKTKKMELALERVANLNRSQKDRHHVHNSGLPDVLPRGLGCGDDLGTASNRGKRSGLFEC